MSDTQHALLSALTYLDREGTMSASDIGLFAIGDPWLFDRLKNGEAVRDGEVVEALSFVVRTLDKIMVKLHHRRMAASEAIEA